MKTPMANSPVPKPPARPEGEPYLRLINQVNAVILAGGDLSQVLDKVVDVIRDVLEVERVSILLQDSGSGRLRVRAAHGIPRDQWDRISIAPGEGIAGRVAAEGLPLMAGDIATTELTGTRGQGYADNSFLSVPLVIQGRILGVLNLNNRTDKTPLGEADLQLGLAVAAMVSLAVENAHLLSSALTLQAHFRDVLRELKHGVICTDSRALITRCNPAAGRILAIAPDQVIGREIRTALSADLWVLLRRLITESRQTGTHAEEETELPRGSSGEALPVRVTATTLDGSSGMGDALVLVLEDLSLSREVAELRRLDELKSNFMAMVSHELRTPLTAIKGAIHLLEGGGFEGDAAQRRPMYDLLRKNTERLIIQINNILDVNQLEHQTMTLFTRRQSLRQLFEISAQPARQDFEEKGVAFDVQVAEHLEIEADTERLTQVFRHLLDNALKFTPRGGKVRIWTEEEPGAVAVHIRDSGIGLDEQFRDKVFAKFFQLEHTLTRQAGGNGLGLYLAKGIVELHGGSIGFLPVKGPGAEVVVKLPFTAPSGSEVIANREGVTDV
jgi:PAS domain S-box-containing protein